MGGGTTIRAAGALGARAGGPQDAPPAAGGGTGGAARHGRPPRVLSVSASTSPASSSSRATLLMERGGRPQPSPCFCDGDGLEGEAGGATGFGFAERSVFGPVPSKEEVVEAVSAIQQIFFPFIFPRDVQDQLSSSIDKDIEDRTIITDTIHGVPSPGSKSDWIKPLRQLYSGNNIQYRAHDKVIDAFRLLQINPSIQRTVISLSSDKAVWDAVMKNEAMKELRKSIFAAESASSDDGQDVPAENHQSPSSNDGQDVPSRLLKWIIEYTMEKIMEFINKIVKIVSGLPLLHEKDKLDQLDPLEDALRSSFMLSIMIFIVVVITRFIKALQ